jgi:hypothetical protein
MVCELEYKRLIIQETLVDGVVWITRCAREQSRNVRRPAKWMPILRVPGSDSLLERYNIGA